MFSLVSFGLKTFFLLLKWDKLCFLTKNITMLIVKKKKPKNVFTILSFLPYFFLNYNITSNQQKRLKKNH